MTAGKRRTIATALCLMLMMLFTAFLVPASATAENGGNKSLTLTCRRDNITLTGMEWKVYKVGERRNGDFVLTGNFASYPVYLKDMSASSVTAAAKTLESYATVDRITPDGKGKTDKNGEVTFTGLESGLYLADGKLLKVNEVYYVPSSILIEITDDGDSFRYDAYPKFYYATLNDEITAYTVKKVWVDDDDANEERPVNVTVDVYRDDEYYDTVTLDESNNWFYHWEDDEGPSEWFVVERYIPVHYDVAISTNETQFLIKNSYGREVLTDPFTTTTTTATSTLTSAADTSSSSEPQTTVTQTQSTVVTTKPGGGLISTGQLWWPVIPLILGGVLLVGIAVAIRPKKEKNEK